MAKEAIDWQALGVDDAIQDLRGVDVFDVFLGDLDPNTLMDATTLVNAASEIAKGGVAKYTSAKAAEAAKAADIKNTKAGVAADQALADALTKLYTAQGKSQSEAVLSGFRTIVSVKRSAALAIPATADRTNACAAAVQKAADTLSNNPSDIEHASALRAWQEVCSGVGGVSAPAPTSGDAPVLKSEESSPSFLTKKHWGVPTWGWGVGGTAVVTGLALTVRAILRRK
jgi:hypothetical protein